MSTATAAAAAEGKTANGNSNGSNKRKRPRKEEVAGEHYPSFTSNKTKWFITAFAIVNYSAHCTEEEYCQEVACWCVCFKAA
jgi:hypothetical protein